MRIKTSQIIDWLEEDLPYFDLTTKLLGVNQKPYEMAFYSREDAIICGTEEAQVLVKEVNAKVLESAKSGDAIHKGISFFKVQGEFAALNEIVKVIQNIFEFSSGIATRTERLVRTAKAVNPKINILTTRKVFPGTKALSIKAILAGGAYPHRLGLSETILLFEQHIAAIGGFKNLPKIVENILENDCEKQILVEVNNADEARQIMALPIHGIQYDKFPPATLTKIVAEVSASNPQLIQLAAGGIHLQNAAEYAKTGVHGLVTTSPYFGKPIDIGVHFRAL